MKISVKLIEHEKEFIANCPELDINCYGSNRDEAVRRLKSVIHFYVDSAKELGLDIDSVNEIFIDGEHTPPEPETDNEPKITSTTIN